MALTSMNKQVSSLIINKVPSEDVYQQMVAQNLINDNEIYIVQDNNNKSGVITIREIPAVTASDNGKFLRVVNGAWAAVTIANANRVKF